MNSTLTAEDRRQAIASAAEKLGYTVEKIDLRSCFAHIRKGSEVRLVAFHKSASESNLVSYVHMASRVGERLDMRESSLYFSV